MAGPVKAERDTSSISTRNENESRTEARLDARGDLQMAAGNMR